MLRFSKKVNQILLLLCAAIIKTPLLFNLQGLNLSFFVDVAAVMGNEYHNHVSTVISQYNTTPCISCIALTTAITIQLLFILAWFGPCTQVDIKYRSNSVPPVN